jgi:hypothetical protein
MPALAERPRPADLSGALTSFLAVLEHAPLADAETVLAFLALFVADEVGRGRIKPEDADWLFTRIDVYLTDLGRRDQLTDEAGELILEGEHFHHFGAEWGPDLGHLSRLALAILGRAKGEARPPHG